MIKSLTQVIFEDLKLTSGHIAGIRAKVFHPVSQG